MTITAYGRGRSDLGKIHLDGDAPYWSACGHSLIRSVSDRNIEIIDCKACRKIADRIRVLRVLAEANGGTFSVKADGIIRGLVERGVIERVKPAGRGGFHAAFYQFKSPN
jgi:hypothetical protein